MDEEKNIASKLFFYVHQAQEYIQEIEWQRVKENYEDYLDPRTLSRLKAQSCFSLNTARTVLSRLDPIYKEWSDPYTPIEDHEKATPLELFSQLYSKLDGIASPSIYRHNHCVDDFSNALSALRDRIKNYETRYGSFIAWNGSVK